MEIEGIPSPPPSKKPEQHRACLDLPASTQIKKIIETGTGNPAFLVSERFRQKSTDTQPWKKISPFHLRGVLVWGDDVAQLDVDHVQSAADGEGLVQDVVAVLLDQRLGQALVLGGTNVIKKKCSCLLVFRTLGRTPGRMSLTWDSSRTSPSYKRNEFITTYSNKFSQYSCSPSGCSSTR